MIHYLDVWKAFDAPVLEGVNFQVERGEILAIVGPSGSGKSTVADLLTRHFDPDHGSIRLDGHDLREVSLPDLRRHIASVDQDPFVFNCSIEENIRYADPSAESQAVVEAAAAAGLQDFLAGLGSCGRQGYSAISRGLLAGLPDGGGARAAETDFRPWLVDGGRPEDVQDARERD